MKIKATFPIRTFITKIIVSIIGRQNLDVGIPDYETLEEILQFLRDKGEIRGKS